MVQLTAFIPSSSTNKDRVRPVAAAPVDVSTNHTPSSSPDFKLPHSSSMIKLPSSSHVHKSHLLPSFFRLQPSPLQNITMPPWKETEVPDVSITVPPMIKRQQFGLPKQPLVPTMPPWNERAVSWDITMPTDETSESLVSAPITMPTIINLQQVGMHKLQPLLLTMTPGNETVVCEITMPTAEPGESLVRAPITIGQTSTSQIKSQGLRISTIANQIIENTIKQELWRICLGCSLASTCILVPSANNISSSVFPIIITANAIAIICILSGLLLRGIIHNKLAGLLQLFGIFSSIIGVFVIFASVLPLELAWIAPFLLLIILFGLTRVIKNKTLTDDE